MASRGRPYFVAVLPDEQTSLEVRDKFYQIIDTLTWREQRGLGRALFINPDGIRTNYKTRARFPGIEVAQRVIEWDKRGRPLTTRKVDQSFFDL